MPYVLNVRKRHGLSRRADAHTEPTMTLTQLNAFVLVARLGSVRAAAVALEIGRAHV